MCLDCRWHKIQHKTQLAINQSWESVQSSFEISEGKGVFHLGLLQGSQTKW